MDDPVQRALQDIERHLARDDPAFVARMRGERRELPRFPTIAALCTTLYILLPLVMLLFGWPVVVGMIDAFAVVIAAVLIRRHRARPGARRRTGH